MSILFRVMLDLCILVGAYKMDQTGYGTAFAAVTLFRYELGPFMNKDD